MKLTAFLRRGVRLAFALALFLLPLRARVLLLARPAPPVYGDYTDFMLYASDFALLALLVCWGAALLLERRAPRRGPLLVTAPLIGLTLVGLATAPFSVDPALSLYHVARLVALFGLYLYVVNEVVSLGELVWPLAAQVTVQSLVAIAQFLSQHSLGLKALGELELNPAVSGVSIVWANGVRLLRAYGLADHPNLLGGCLALALIALGGWFTSTASRWRWAAGAAFALGSVGLLLTFSRAAELALGVSVFALLAWHALARQKGAALNWLKLLAVAALACLPFAWRNSAFIGARLNVDDSFTQVPTETRSLAERSALVDATNQLLAEHPLTGVGLGALPLALRQAFPDFPFNYQPAHNTLLESAAETGVFGALLYFMLLTGPWLALWLSRKNLRLTPELIGASGLLLALTVIGQFDYYPWLLAPGRLWQWTAWGLWAAAYQRAREAVHA
jgi:O-antigen ligase